MKFRTPSSQTAAPSGVAMVHLALAKRFDEERRGARQDFVLGLEPCEPGENAVVALQFAEAHEGVHFVDFALDGAFHGAGVAHVAVGFVVEQAGVFFDARYARRYISSQRPGWR